MTGDAIAAIAAEVHALAHRAGIDASNLPTFGRSVDGGCPHVEVVPGGWALVVVERGVELERRRYARKDDLLYRVLSDAAFLQASHGPHKPRSAPGHDPRRAMFAEQLRLLGLLSADWRARAEREIAGTLARHPYRDV